MPLNEARVSATLAGRGLFIVAGAIFDDLVSPASRDAARLAMLRYPDIAAGVEGVRWVENRLRSATQGGVWFGYV